MTTTPRSSLGSIADIIGYVALVLIAVVEGFLYFEEKAPPPAPAPPAPVAPRITTPAESLLDRLSRQARSGDLVSQRQLGQLYFEGREVRQDYDEAVKWLRLAGDKGDMVAARYLGDA